MKFKNYRSAIHNFAHSFMSVDYMKSNQIAVDALIDLYNANIETKAVFDFIKKTIQPIQINTKATQELLNDYLSWLPDHFMKHNCDLYKLEKLEITILADFKRLTTPIGRSNFIEIDIHTSTKWKADGHEDEVIKITQTEVLHKSYPKFRISGFKL